VTQKDKVRSETQRAKTLQVAVPLVLVLPANEGLSPSFPAAPQLGIV
jgi:hypothetical protein